MWTQAQTHDGLTTLLKTNVEKGVTFFEPNLHYTLKGIKGLFMCFASIHFSFWQLLLCKIKSPLTRINFRYLTFHCLYGNYVFVFGNSIRTQLEPQPVGRDQKRICLFYWLLFWPLKCNSGRYIYKDTLNAKARAGREMRPSPDPANLTYIAFRRKKTQARLR